MYLAWKDRDARVGRMTSKWICGMAIDVFKWNIATCVSFLERQRGSCGKNASKWICGKTIDMFR